MRRLLRKSNCGFLGVLVLALATSNLSAAVVSHTGTFATDDEVEFFAFTLADPLSLVEIKTFGYAGGVQADSTVIPDGGFDPMLWLFDGDGFFIDENDDSFFFNVGVDPVSGEEFDSFLIAFLPAGDYTLALTQFDNAFVGFFGDHISDGFTREGEPSFTGDDAGLPGDMFVEFFGEGDPPIFRTGAWALDIGSSAAVPEPSSFILLGMGGLVLLGGYTRRRRKQQVASE